MSIRTSAGAVIALMAPGDDYDDTLGEAGIQPFIETASALVDWAVSNASKYNRIALSAAQAELVERWLSAGFYKESDRQQTGGNAGRASASFVGKPDENSYMRRALDMDTSRMIRPVLEGRIASSAWLGKRPSDQIPYRERD